MIDLQELAETSKRTAIARDKMSEDTSPCIAYCDIMDEATEVLYAHEDTPSQHIRQFSELQEELADVMIVCMSYLSAMDTDIEHLLKTKVKYNEERKD